MPSSFLADTVRQAGSWPNWDPGLWSAVRVALWVVGAAVFYFFFRDPISDIGAAVLLRVKSGASVKAFNIELGELRVPVSGAPTGGSIEVRPAPAGLKDLRDRTYAEQHHVFLAHRLFASVQPGQLYDILIYLIPHSVRSGSLESITRVEYYLGASWGDRIFISRDRGKKFGVVVSSYGTAFLCSARIYYSDKNGEAYFDTWRYIDFEMGSLGS